MKEKIKALQKNLDCTEQEALDIIECDKRIDKGEKLFELDQKGKQVEKSMKQTRAVDAYGRKRVVKKKEDSLKAEIMGFIIDALESGFELRDLVVVNPERELTCKIQNRKFKIVLSEPRT